ncbi:VOC family protein [Halanaerobium sp. ST460_2HS_T2]|uniref:VOC family protein n=1 Tax=Halanaerobium sp. ST460_2HS_T2 TaxID=2183914 RepID=UPI000DF175F5|nr:VOC family protein [Halanaerobium sp. ST460_2HS_T2]RCW52380.1 catechol 2,3-dioxygenase [Halanaerobium sp. ST460_2HS_T2]
MKNFHDKPNKYVDQISLRVRDLEESLEFYTEIMGFKILEEKKNKVRLSVNNSTPIVTLVYSEDIIEKIPNRTGLYHYAMLMPKRYQLGTFLKNLREKNYDITGGADHGVSEAIYIKDPDGNGIEIYSDYKSSEWPQSNGQIEMITDPLDYKELLSETGDKKWNGMPEKAKIGHIHLHVSDLEKSEKFYVQGLGFNIIQKLGGSALFLSTGGYHHHIGLNTWNGVGAAPLPENAAGMEYYTIKFPDQESRSESIENLKQLGYQVREEDNDIFTEDPAANSIKLDID